MSGIHGFTLSLIIILLGKTVATTNDNPWTSGSEVDLSKDNIVMRARSEHAHGSYTSKGLTFNASPQLHPSVTKAKNLRYGRC